jgi:coenzyme F420-reducing hydrogenase delta subunit
MRCFQQHKEKKMSEIFEPTIIAFCCKYCAYAAADLAGSMRLSYPSNVKVSQVPCTGRVDIVHLLRAIEDGADGVYVAGCLEGDCHFVSGNLKARQRVEYVKRTLKDLEIEPERVEMFNLSSAMGPRFAEIANEMTERIRKLGPSPVKINQAA